MSNEEKVIIAWCANGRCVIEAGKIPASKIAKYVRDGHKVESVTLEVFHTLPFLTCAEH